MRKGLLFSLVIASMVPSQWTVAETAVPALKAPKERADPDFRQPPRDQDLREHMLDLQSAISSMDIPPKNIPGIDYFIVHLEKALRRGTDVPRDDILHNADTARETLRLAYGDMSETAFPLLPRAQDALDEVAQALSGLLDRNRGSVDLLRSVADSAQATASAMVLEPPESPGGLVPVETLCGIASLESELKPLRERLKKASKDVKKAKALVRRALERSEHLERLAGKAAEFDKDAAGHARQRRTLGRPDPNRVPLQSRDVILSANHALQRSARRAGDIAGAMERQLDPGQDGLRRAVDKALEADALTQNAKALEVQSGVRINYNHTVRLNDLIRRGWEAARPERRQWWVGRAGMAKGEARTDAGKMDAAHAQALEGAETAEQLLQSGLSGVADIDGLLGPSRMRLRAIAQRFSDAPAPTVAVRKRPPGKDVDSQALKRPGAFSSGGRDVRRTFDGGAEP